MPDLGVVLADDHPIVLSGLTQLFAGEPGFSVLATCRSGREMLAAVERHRPGVLLLDVCLPDGDGVELLPRVAVCSPLTSTVIFAASLDEERIVTALYRGAKAVLFKETPAAELISSVRRAAAGVGWIAPEEIASDATQLADRAPSHRTRPLSPREREVAELVARGERNKEIAWQLGLAEGTVKLYIFRAYRKLGVSNRVGLSRVIAGTNAAGTQRAQL
ncbi:MAG TPA: response regulator transcription factor [Stellaceae bacterium]|nr:response regulator transcription factor [Stellaceae bacterium]